MSDKAVLITGADGYLGSRLARAYLERTDRPVYLWVRSRDEEEFASKSRVLLDSLAAWPKRVTCHSGDLRAETPFHSVNPRQVGSIVHSAAVTRFNVDETTAQTVNVEGTGKLLDFASRCDALDSVAVLSTVYASGLKPGLIEEKPFRGEWGFANQYERSKWAAESLVLERYNHLPWRIFRVATVVSDNASGHVTQYNAFHNTLKLLYYGLMSLVPGHSSTPLYFLTGDFAVDAMYQAFGASPLRSFYHVAHTRKESITLGRLIDIAFETFESQENFRLRRSLKPLYSDLESFEMLDSAIHGFGGGILNDALASVSPFARQLFVAKDVSNLRLTSALSRPAAPAAEEMIRSVCGYLISSRWGSRPGANHVQ